MVFTLIHEQRDARKLWKWVSISLCWGIIFVHSRLQKMEKKTFMLLHYQISKQYVEEDL